MPPISDEKGLSCRRQQSNWAALGFSGKPKSWGVGSSGNARSLDINSCSFIITTPRNSDGNPDSPQAVVFLNVDYRCDSWLLKRITYTIIPHKTGIRLLGVARNPDNGFPARPLGCRPGCSGLYCIKFPELKLRAERGLGVLLEETVEHGGGGDRK